MKERPKFNWLEKKLMKLKPIRRLIIEGYREGVRMQKEIQKQEAGDKDEKDN